MTTLQAIALAIIEELLNFCQFLHWTYGLSPLPFGIVSDDFTKLFTIVIQLGAAIL
jgi:undecaprenyl-diphosphatase